MWIQSRIEKDKGALINIEGADIHIFKVYLDEYDDELQEELDNYCVSVVRGAKLIHVYEGTFASCNDFVKYLYHSLKLNQSKVF